MQDIKLKFKSGHTSEREWMSSSPLKTLFWNVTYACNFQCPICFTDSNKPLRRELSTAEALQTVEKAHHAGVQDIIISGGEPFMREDLIDILARMAKFGITARIASNGSLLTEDILGRLKDETLTKSFQISLETIDPTLYAEFHQVPQEILNSVLNTLSRIRAHGFHTTVSVRLTPQTLPGIPDLLDLACKEGWPTVTVHCPVHTKRVKDAYPQDDDLISRLHHVFEYFCTLPSRWLIETYIPWACYHPQMKQIQRKVKIVHRGCRAGRDRLTINPTGLLSPCVCMDVPEAYVGDVRQDDISEVFLNSPICDMFRRPKEHGICVDCPNVAECGGGCRASAFVLSGQISGQDRSCPVWKRKADREREKGDIETGGSDRFSV